MSDRHIPFTHQATKVCHEYKTNPQSDLMSPMLPHNYQNHPRNMILNHSLSSPLKQQHQHNFRPKKLDDHSPDMSNYESIVRSSGQIAKMMQTDR